MDKKTGQKHGDMLSDNPDLAMIEILPAKKNGMTARFGNFFLYSQYEPIKKIVEEYGQLDLKSRIVVLLGIGLGYLLDLLVNDNRVELIYLIETDLSFFKKAVKTAGLGPWNSKVIHIADRQSLYRIAEKIDLLVYDRVEIIREKTFVHTRQTIQEEDINFTIQEKISEQMTMARFGMVWYDNFLSRFTDLEGLKTAEMPVETVRKNAENILIIGAGPSLKNSLEEIRAQQEYFLIVCIDTVRSWLIRNGIFPDITVSTDSQNISALHFDLKKGSPPGEETFLLDTLISSAVLKALKHGKISFFRSENPLNFFFSDNVPSVQSGLSAANVVIDLIYHLGARKIVLAGIDLSYPTNEPYAGGNYFSKYWAARISRTKPLDSRYAEYMRHRRYISVPGMEGETVRTTPVMRSYAEGIEKFLNGHRDLELTSLSKIGIRMEGVGKRDVLVAPAVKKNICDAEESKIGFNPYTIGIPARDTSKKEKNRPDNENYGAFFNKIQPALTSLLYKKKKRGHILSEKMHEEALGIIIHKWEKALERSVTTPR